MHGTLNRPESTIVKAANGSTAVAAAGPAVAALALMLLAALSSASAQDLQAEIALPVQPGVADEPAGVARSAIEPPREMTVEEAEKSLDAREERMWDEYDKGQRAAVDVVGPSPEELVVEDPPPALEVPPQPDAPDGAITLERQQQEGWQ